MVNESDLIEERISSERIYDGARISCRRDTVKLGDGKTVIRDVVDHPGAVCILPMIGPDKVCLVQQYRYPLEQITLEVPAGCMEANEDPLETAKRELQEETGYLANRWRKLTSVYLAPGFCNEIMHIYLAEDLRMTQQHLDPDEYVNVVECSFKELEKWVLDGTIIDGKTCIAYGLAKNGRDDSR